MVFKEATDSTTAQYYPYEPAHGRIPNCYGMTAKDAVEMLNEMGYRAVVSGYGKVLSQQPKAGTNAPKGTRVELTLR